jgi:hypothetical protein
VHRRLLPAVATLLTALAVGACSDAAVAPRESRARPPAGPVPLADQQTSDPGAPLVGTLPGNDSRTGSGVVALGSFGAEPVLVKAEASGLLAGYAYGNMTQPPGYYDPNGVFLFTENSCRANVEVAGSNGTYVRYCDGRNDNPLQETVTRYAVLQGDISAWRTGGPQNSFGPACDGVFGDGTPTQPCVVFVGQQTVTLTRVQATLSLEPSASEVPQDSTVTFTLSLTPSSMTDPLFGQVPVQMRVVAQRWVPDAAPGATQACGFFGPPTCTRAIRESGTMEVDAVVQGTAMTVRAHVEAKTDSLIISPASASVKPGIEVTFNAKTKNGTPFTVQSWSYTPDTVSSLQLTSVATCGTSKTCKFKAYETGTLTVTGLLQGQTTPQSATARVTVQPCPPDTTGDRRMASVGFRKGLTEAFDNAMTTTSFPRDEVGGDVITNPTTGQVIARPIPGDTATNTCQYHFDTSTRPTIPPGFVLDPVDWHVHMQGPGVPFTGCDNGVQTKTVSVTGQPGPSWKDKANCESFRWYCYLVEGPNGDVYGWNNPLRAPPPASDPPSPIRYWRRDKKSACFVPTPLPKGVNPS